MKCKNISGMYVCMYVCMYFSQNFGMFFGIAKLFQNKHHEVFKKEFIKSVELKSKEDPSKDCSNMYDFNNMRHNYNLLYQVALESQDHKNNNLRNLTSLYKEFHTYRNAILKNYDKEKKINSQENLNTWFKNAEEIFFKKKINVLLNRDCVRNKIVLNAPEEIKNYYLKFKNQEEKEKFLFDMYFNKDNKSYLKEFILNPQYNKAPEAQDLLKLYNVYINPVNAQKLPYSMRKSLKDANGDLKVYNESNPDKQLYNDKGNFKRMLGANYFRAMVAGKAYEEKETNYQWSAPKPYIAKIKGDHVVLSEKLDFSGKNNTTETDKIVEDISKFERIYGLGDWGIKNAKDQFSSFNNFVYDEKQNKYMRYDHEESAYSPDNQYYTWYNRIYQPPLNRFLYANNDDYRESKLVKKSRSKYDDNIIKDALKDQEKKLEMKQVKQFIINETLKPIVR